MSNSSLATYIDRGAGQYTKRKNIISKITIHQASAKGNCEKLSSIIASAPNSSFHYGIGNDGTIGLFVDERFRSWSTGDLDNDHSSVSIMICNSSLSPNYTISDKAWKSLVKLCADICRRNFITELKYTGKKETSNLTIHKWFNKSVNCPGPYLEGRLNKLTKEVNEQISLIRKAQDSEQAKIAQTTLVTSVMEPYVATIDESVKDINFQNLKTLGVVGVMFKAGELFNSLHIKQSKPVNNNLKIQTSLADESKIGYALYWNVRCRDEAEAKDECYQLYFILAKYPPKLGIWLHLDNLPNNKNLNDRILEVYYKNIYKWGLHDKCGIYCTPSDLKRFTWSNFCERMSLWIIDKIDDVSDIPNLLTPKFFKY